MIIESDSGSHGLAATSTSMYGNEPGTLMGAPPYHELSSVARLYPFIVGSHCPTASKCGSSRW